ncbi:MAG TPA: cytochrome C oxidase subunit II [Myxococcaceae bacterium]|nr:cytochrome C oxidase subunit II [Myxococcaceae bacterium]
MNLWGWSGLPRDVSRDGHRIAWLLNSTHLFTLALFAVVVVWMGIACLRHTRKRRPEADYDLGNSRRSIFAALALSAGVFAVVDGNLFIHSVKDLDQAFWNFRLPLSDPNTVRIEVNAHQWAWDARYPGEDGVFQTPDDVVTWNDFTVPVDTPVYLQLTSTDVIHNFYLPNFLIKTDAVPGQVNHLWFQAKETGRFEVACSQHCGAYHYKMRAQLTVLSRGEYRAWARVASDSARRGYDPDDASAHWGWAWKPR